MNDDEFIKKKLLEGINGINHFMCEKCGDIVQAYSLGINFKPILKGKCKACSKETMINKRERYPDCEHWMHIIEYTPEISKLEAEAEAMKNGTYHCPDCGIISKTPRCKTCYEKYNKEQELLSNEQTIR